MQDLAPFTEETTSDDECSRTTDNFFMQCPARMSDGRHFTDYRNRKVAEYENMTRNGLKTNAEYKAFMQDNAEEILFDLREQSNRRMYCGPCDKPVFELRELKDDPPITHVPYEFGAAPPRPGRCGRANNVIFPAPSVSDANKLLATVHHRVALPGGGDPMFAFKPYFHTETS